MCDDAWKFCPHDGTDLTARGAETVPIARKQVCPKCGAKYDSRMKFCQKDGTALVSA